MVVFATVALLLFSCGNKENSFPTITNRSQFPLLYTTDVVSMISDSGVTRYRISAAEWLIYDQVPEPYWEFPKGACFERFDNNYQTDASIRADSVVFYSSKNLWRLSGNVQAQNLKQEKFKTSLLFWNQETERIYTDELVEVTQSDKILKGQGFESNQTMDQYTLRNVQAIIPLQE